MTGASSPIPIKYGFPGTPPDYAYIYLTKSQLPNILLLDSFSIAPDSRGEERLSSLLYEGTEIVGFVSPASAASLRTLFPSGTDPDVLAARVHLDAALCSYPILGPDLVALPNMLPRSTISALVFRDDQQLRQLQATLSMNGLDISNITTEVDPSVFGGTAEVPPSRAAGLTDALSPAAAAKLKRYERLMGSLVAGPINEGLLDRPTSYAFTLAARGAPKIGDQDITRAGFEALGMSFSEPFATAWLEGTGSTRPNTDEQRQSAAAPTLASVDARVAEACYRVLLTFNETTLAPALLLDAALDAVGNIDSLHGDGFRERYRKAAELIRHVHSNKARLDQVLSIWVPGFESMQACLLLGTINEDEAVRLWERSAKASVSSTARLLARSFFGLAFGIRAVPDEYRARAEARTAAHAFVRSVIGYPLVAPVDATVEVARTHGRGSKRKLEIVANAFGHETEWEATAQFFEVAASIDHLRSFNQPRMTALANTLLSRKLLARHLAHHVRQRAEFPRGISDVMLEGDGVAITLRASKAPTLKFIPVIPDWEAFLDAAQTLLVDADPNTLRSWREAVARAAKSR